VGLAYWPQSFATALKLEKIVGFLQEFGGNQFYDWHMKTLPQLPTVVSSAAQLEISKERRAICCRIPISCSPATLYSVWSDVDHWHVWDPDTRQAHLTGPFKSGSVGKLQPKKGLPIKIRVTNAEPPRCFTVVSRVLGTQFIFNHQLELTNGGVMASHEVVFSGWSAGLFMKTVGVDVANGLPLTMTRLKFLCEAKEQNF
jgi:hypothetical protein